MILAAGANNFRFELVKGNPIHCDRLLHRLKPTHLATDTGHAVPEEHPGGAGPAGDETLHVKAEVGVTHEV